MQAPIGQKFFKLTVLEESENKGENRYVKCICDCGTVKDIRLAHLRHKKIISCGCENIKRARERRYFDGRGGMKTHDMSHTWQYNSWLAMKQRCTNPNHKNFKYYGAKGIKICNEWLYSFENFIKDMGIPKSKMTLDRIDNNLGYFKDNCKWSTRSEQSNNRRCNILVEYNGEIRTISKWSQIIGIKRNTLSDRIKKGMPVEKAFETPVVKRKKNVRSTRNNILRISSV